MKKVTLFVSKLSVRRGFTLMILMALPLWFVSCKTDRDGDGNPDVKPASIAGSWKINGMKVSPAIDLGDGQMVSDLFQLFAGVPGGKEALACLTDSKITLNSNGTVTGTASPNCQSDEADDLNPAKNNARWSVNGDKITITDDSGSATYDLEHSGNTMKWSIKEQEDMDMDGDGKVDTYTTTIEFKKA